jgi:hypothetical protein
MDPNATRHAAVIFIAVFGGLALWFAAYLLMIVKRPGPPQTPGMHAAYRMGSLFWGFAVVIPAFVVAAIALQFW